MFSLKIVNFVGSFELLNRPCKFEASIECSSVCGECANAFHPKFFSAIYLEDGNKEIKAVDIVDSTF